MRLANMAIHFSKPVATFSFSTHRPLEQSVYRIESVGCQQYDNNVFERLVESTKHLPEVMKKKNNRHLLNTPRKRQKTNTSGFVPSVKGDRNLFSRLYVASQCRDGNLNDFSLTRINHVQHHCQPGETRIRRRVEPNNLFQKMGGISQNQREQDSVGRISEEKNCHNVT